MTHERMSWWRAHHGLATNSKWLSVARKSGQPVPVVLSVAVSLMEHASKARDRGCISDFEVGDCAAFLWIEDEAVTAVMEAMRTIGWIVDGRIAPWSKHQPLREDTTATERKQAERARKAQKDPSDGNNGGGDTGSHAMSHDVTQRPENVTPREEKRREESKQETLNWRGRDRSDLDALEGDLRSAAALQNDPTPALFDLSPILGLLDAGYDYPTEVRPIVKAKARPGVRTWGYFVGAIQDARATRDAAATGVGNARAGPVTVFPSRQPRRNETVAAAEELLAEMKAGRP